MARTIADINRTCTPMHCIEENLDENRETLRIKRNELLQAQNTKSPFLIGSIEEVNRKISNLDQQLQSYTDLIIESRASQKTQSDVFEPPSSDLIREAQQQKAFFSKPSERVKNISKITMDPSKTTVKKDSGKPKFVELQQYPGYDSTELTPLPNDVTATEILSTVAEAQSYIKPKSKYKPEFDRLFYCEMSQAVLQDAFWWLFLDKWHPVSKSQQKLFNRIAHNYVKLLTFATHPQYRETFLRDYPSLLSQAVYAAYCTSFPDSYRIFDETFKEDLVGLIYEWISGCRPAPRLWLAWNFAKLEPPGLKQREKLIKQSKAKNASSNLSLDFVELLGISPTVSESTLNQCDSVSSVSTDRMQKKLTPNQSQRSISSLAIADTCAISEVTKGQGQAKSSSNQLGDQSARKDGMKKTEYSRTKHLEPITEAEERQAELISPGKGSKNSLLQPVKKRSRESHPIGKVADFVHGSFNTYGQSPLVAHFLKMKGLQVDAGLHARVRRTELHNLPPLDAPTYSDLIKDTYKQVRQNAKNYSKLSEQDLEDKKKFIRKQKHQQVAFKRKEALLLSNRLEVKRISDLIMLELKKDHDSIGTGIMNEIEATLDALES